MNVGLRVRDPIIEKCTSGRRSKLGFEREFVRDVKEKAWYIREKRNVIYILSNMVCAFSG